MLIIVLLTNCTADKKIPNKRQRFVDRPWYLLCFLQPLSVERYGYITLLVYKIRKITLFFPQEISVHITENYHTLMQRKNISNCSLHAPFSHRPPFIVSVHVSPRRLFSVVHKHLACRSTQNAASKYHWLLKITHNKTINSFINKGNKT